MPNFKKIMEINKLWKSQKTDCPCRFSKPQICWQAKMGLLFEIIKKDTPRCNCPCHRGIE